MSLLSSTLPGVSLKVSSHSIKYTKSSSRNKREAPYLQGIDALLRSVSHPVRTSFSLPIKWCDMTIVDEDFCFPTATIVFSDASTCRSS
ncbi:uncharacterized [Tachysurus ichikawai]